MSAEAVERAVRDAGLTPLEPEAADQFAVYLELLLKWNARLNLTAIRNPEGILRRHFVESIQCAQSLPALPERGTVLDFGSGAGLPGIPIAICRPDLRVTMAESQGKKAAFLREAVRSLGLSAEVYDGRVEDMPAGRSFSAVTLRAVDKMVPACKAALRLVAEGGWILPFATGSTAADIRGTVSGVDWVREVPIAGSEQGLILVGKRRLS